MAIVALAGLLKLCQLSFDRHNVFVGSRFLVVMTGSATDNRHIRSKTAQCADAGNIYVTGRALNRMRVFAALMTELRRLPHRQIVRNKRCGRLMTTAAIGAGGFLILPMAVEA